MINSKFTNTLCLALLILPLAESYGQSRRNEKYDSLIVGDLITPAVSAVLMPKGFTEVLLSNALLTTNQYFKEDRSTLNLDYRSTYFINTLQVTHGVGSSGRINVGLDLTYRTGRADSDPNSSPLAVFGNSSDGLIEYARGFTSFGVRTRYAPIKNKNFVIQQAFYIPINPSSEDNEFLGDNRYAFNTQFLYTQLLGRKFFLFGQADVLLRFKNDEQDFDITNPLNLFVTYLLTKHVFPFVQLGMVNAWNGDFDHLRQSFNYGLGLQYQFTTMFNVNLFYTDVFAGKTTNSWNTFNLGIRVVL